jgi:hypothetical protein
MISGASTVPPACAAAASAGGWRAAIEGSGRLDLLHACQGMPAIVCAPIARRLGVPLVVTLDSGELTSIDDIGYGLQRRWIDRRAVAVALGAASRVTVSTLYISGMMPHGTGTPGVLRRCRR